MTYDFRSRRADSYEYYVLDDRPRRVIYGPYRDKTDAEVAWTLTLDFNKINDQLNQNGRWDKHAPSLRNGYYVGTVGKDDIESLKSDPESNGFKSFTIKSPSALKVHPSWRVRPYDVPNEQAALYLVTGITRHLDL
jgi:hypothetical protein